VQRASVVQADQAAVADHVGVDNGNQLPAACGLAGQVGVEFARESPPLAAFLSALQLFVDTFRGGDATRLISLGRPLLSSAGLYTFGGLANVSGDGLRSLAATHVVALERVRRLIRPRHHYVTESGTISRHRRSAE
jgi:hypothetical protein